MKSRAFSDEQRHYWRAIDAAHFEWQTEGGYIAETEAQLLASVEVAPGERMLEIGCGEGANLRHLESRGAKLFGVDFTLEKAGFASQTGALTACADAGALPFRDGAFDAILIRDLLHHVPDRVGVLREAHRVVRDGGTITVIEPNGRNPLIAAQAMAIRAERGMLVSTGTRLTDELAQAGFADVLLERAQPMPISRVVLHYKMGAPSLARFDPIVRLLGFVEGIAEYLPGALWAYLIAKGRKNG
jgi:SAM-dependent methyltransferase